MLHTLPEGQPTSMQLRHRHWPELQIGVGAAQSEFWAQPTHEPARQTDVEPEHVAHAPPPDPQFVASIVVLQTPFDMQPAQTAQVPLAKHDWPVGQPVVPQPAQVPVTPTLPLPPGVAENVIFSERLATASGV
jgi:hypothetical protein